MHHFPTHNISRWIYPDPLFVYCHAKVITDPIPVSAVCLPEIRVYRLKLSLTHLIEIADPPLSPSNWETFGFHCLWVIASNVSVKYCHCCVVSIFYWSKSLLRQPSASLRRRFNSAVSLALCPSLSVCVCVSVCLSPSLRLWLPASLHAPLYATWLA